mmetsp:Transcript_48849/g.55331  ORF Transcript_48849/g.55331 Transcript_48849/m.55331 type:complete len:257 (-) Transcript_48849:315-1085(-)
MDDENLFGAPPSDDFFNSPEDTPVAGLPPAVEDAGFTLLGEAEGSGNAAFVGDVQDTAGAAADDDDDMGFAAAPTGDGSNQDMGFAGAPVADNNEGGEPPAIILGAPAPDDDVVGFGEDAVGVVDDASEDAEEPIVEKIAPSAMKKYNAEFQDTLVQRKEEEEQAKIAMTEAARVFMEEFQANIEAKRDSKMALNREDEQVKLESIEADLENDNSWQRVTNTVELTQDSAEDSTQRMRDIFILLKNEPGLAAKVGA